MKSFDAHSDIFTDVTMRRLKGETNVFEKYHLKRLHKGGIGGTILVVWIDPPHTDNPSWRMLEILGALSEEIEDMKDFAGVVYKYSDMVEIKNAGKMPFLIGMEGLSGLRGNVSIINMLYKLGIRHASLTWNEENEFATGVRGNPQRGVTQAGIKALKRLEELGIIVDVSHANEKTFWDVYENTQKPFIASHSNAWSLCNAQRNLKDEQIKAIKERGGIIGMNSWPDFIDEANPTVEKLANHLDYIVNLIGIDHVGFGFDFCDFLQGDTTSSFQGGESTAAIGLEDASKVPVFIDILKNRGYKDEDIGKLTWGNFERIIKEIVK